MSCLVSARPAAPSKAFGKGVVPVFLLHQRSSHASVSAPLSRRLRAMALAAAIATVSVAPVAAQDGQVNSATIQWAQQILDQQGFYQGRASGKMDSATAAAISAYQRKRGLKATGRLDQATIDTLLRDQPERKGVGNLADPTSRAKPSVPILKESEVKPQAAPTAPGVERGSGTENTVLGAARGNAGASAPDIAPRGTVAAPAAPDAGQPAGDIQAAPRSSVEAENIGPREEDRPFDLANFDAPNWARFGLIGAIAIVILGMVVNWWLSGRRRRPAARKPAATRRQPPAAGPVRREPTLGGGADAGRREPVFTAPARDPRRVR